MRHTALAVLAPVTALVLAGCGGSGSSTPNAGDGSTQNSTPQSTSTSGGSTTASGSPFASQVEGVRLTVPGSQLQLGQTARMSWKPDRKTVGVVAMSVTRLRQVSINTFSDWRLDAATRRSTPYFVNATVRNLGRSNLSGRAVPLYLLDRSNTLLQSSTFQAGFPACPSRPLPAKFTRGKKASVCLVYFIPGHGKFAAVSFRPDQAFDAITWQGHVGAPGKSGHRHKKKHH